MEKNADIGNSKPRIYETGNQWQRDRYKFMGDYNLRHGITEFGCAQKDYQPYYHLITEKDCLHNFLGLTEILKEVKQRKDQGKLGDYHRLLTNTVASQPCCFNLFVPLKNRMPLASKLICRIMNREVEVRHIEIEFTPYVKKKNDRNLKGFAYRGDESLDDQSKFGGTDADVAVFYTYDAGRKRGVILIEFKYIEAEFSVCTSYKEKSGATKDNPNNKNIRPICDSEAFYDLLIAPDIDADSKPTQPDCGYLKYKNWQLLEKSKVFDINAIKSFDHCPFRFSLQQLWRNMLLAENVKRVRKLDEFQFWVLAPDQNTYLWKDKNGSIFEQMERILTSKGKNAFRKIDLKSGFIEVLHSLPLGEWESNWLYKFEKRYLTQIQ